MPYSDKQMSLVKAVLIIVMSIAGNLCFTRYNGLYSIMEMDITELDLRFRALFRCFPQCDNLDSQGSSTI